MAHLYPMIRSAMWKIRRLVRKPQPTQFGEPWMLGELIVNDDGVEASGYALPPLGAAPSLSRFLLNDKRFGYVEYPNRSENVGAAIVYRNASHVGFRLKSGIPKEGLYPNGYMTLRYEHPLRGNAWYHDSYFVLPPSERKPLPEGERRIRVAGKALDEPFHRAGFTDFMRIHHLCEDRFGRGFSKLNRVLDWGCGCGRVVRYFDRFPNVQATGADVDADNIGWCKANLPGIRFAAVPLMPRTEFADGSFDLIYGISVFTHLREKAQFAWLEELRRISAPGAIVVMSFHGRSAYQYLRAPDSWLETIQAKGFHITSSNGQLDAVIEDKDYYVNVGHSHDYIRSQWSKYFEIVDFIPGFIGTHDVVVMRRT